MRCLSHIRRRRGPTPSPRKLDSIGKTLKVPRALADRTDGGARRPSPFAHRVSGRGMAQATSSVDKKTGSDDPSARMNRPGRSTRRLLWLALPLWIAGLGLIGLAVQQSHQPADPAAADSAMSDESLRDAPPFVASDLEAVCTPDPYLPVPVPAETPSLPPRTPEYAPAFPELPGPSSEFANYEVLSSEPAPAVEGSSPVWLDGTIEIDPAAVTSPAFRQASGATRHRQ